MLRSARARSRQQVGVRLQGGDVPAEHRHEWPRAAPECSYATAQRAERRTDQVAVMLAILQHGAGVADDPPAGRRHRDIAPPVVQGVLRGPDGQRHFHRRPVQQDRAARGDILRQRGRKSRFAYQGRRFSEISQLLIDQFLAGAIEGRQVRRHVRQRGEAARHLVFEPDVVLVGEGKILELLMPGRGKQCEIAACGSQFAAAGDEARFGFAGESSSKRWRMARAASDDPSSRQNNTHPRWVCRARLSSCSCRNSSPLWADRRMATAAWSRSRLAAGRRSAGAARLSPDAEIENRRSA